MIRWVVGGDVREVFQQETAESQRDVLLLLLEPCCGLCYLLLREDRGKLRHR